VQFFVLRPMDAEAAAAAAAEGAHVGVRVRRTALTLAAMETLLQVCACACVCGGGGGGALTARHSQSPPERLSRAVRAGVQYVTEPVLSDVLQQFVPEHESMAGPCGSPCPCVQWV
jgi:hypothetical protein